MEHVNNIENLTRSDFSLLWGKYNDGSYHPLIFHMIDTASVAYVLTELYTKEITSFELALIALHDIGKATPGFQSKVPQMRKMLEKQEGQEEQGFVFRPELTRMSDHSELGQWYLPFLLEEFCKMDVEVASEWSRIVTSHHGKVLNLFVDEPVDDDQWAKTREEIFKVIFNLYAVEQYPQEAPQANEAIFLMGLCSIADWIASNENYFPYRSNFSGTIDDYKKESLKFSKSAVNAIGFHRPFYNQKSFEELFPFSPNTLQKAAIEHATYHRDKPMLMIVEAPMGEGKTEAALGAFAKMSSIKPQKGLYFALPTQATSNMMLSRLENFLKHFTIDGAQLHLLHADAMLNEEYHKLKIRSVYGQNGAAIRASEWFVSKKRTLLSDFGVGTIDQAELAALKVKHFFVRLFALAGKTVIIDEVHAYDAYMSGVLEVLLSWLRRMGSSVILLSATLPEEKRRMFLEAFIPECEKSIALAPYPAIHSISSQGVKSETVDGLRTFIATLVPLPSDDWLDAVCRLCEEKLEHGGCAACIVNTVSDAQKLYVKLKEVFLEDEIELFHARFTKKDRLEIEKRVVERFGKNGKRPKRSIVVATQVIEQSLDVDFDLMVSQPAPIDLLLQRMGRLHRHERKRPKGLEKRSLYVLVPTMLEENKEIFGKSRFVYYPDILYKSLTLLQVEGQWREKEVYFPKGLSLLVEAVYGDVLSEESIQKWEEERQGEEYAHYFLSRAATIPQAEESIEILDGLDNAFVDDTDAYNAKTRQVEESVTVVVVENKEKIDILKSTDLKRLYESSLKISHRWICEHFKSIDRPILWQKLPLLRYAKPFQMGETIEKNGHVAYYDKKLGFVIEKKGEEV